MYKYSLIKGSKKTICPKCQKKKLVNYINTETNQLLSLNVGRCDREGNCSYHVSPKEYFGNNLINQKPYSKPVIMPKIKTSYHPNEFAAKALKGSDNFTSFLLTIFSEKEVMSIQENYKVGTSTHWANSTIFWQIDNFNKIRSGKVILYNQAGSRSKYANWIHSILLKNKSITTFNLEQCLFGLHLINTNQKPIAIVESEKTACIMGIRFPKYLWLATGGSNNITDRLFTPIKNKQIVLFPDLSKNDIEFNKWNDKVTYLKKFGFDISISTLLQKNATEIDKEQGLDTADYFLDREYEETKESITKPIIKPIKLQTYSEETRQKLINKNPAIKILIDTFDLRDRSLKY